MKYSPKYKVKSLKSDLSNKSDEILSLKDQIVKLTDQNHQLRRKLQFSSSNVSLINEEYQMKSTLTNEELVNLTQNNQILKVYMQDLQQKYYLLSQAYQREKSEKDALNIDLSRSLQSSHDFQKEKAYFESKLVKKAEKIAFLLKENTETMKAFDQCNKENTELKQKLASLVHESSEYQDKLYKLQEGFQRKEEQFQKDHRVQERSLSDLQRNYEKLYQEFSSLDRLRDGFNEKAQKDSSELKELTEELHKKTNEVLDIKDSYKIMQSDLMLIKQDIRNLVMALTSHNENFPFLIDLKSESQDLNLLKALILDNLKEKADIMKQGKKMMKNQSCLLEDMRQLQGKIIDLSSPLKGSPMRSPHGSMEVLLPGNNRLMKDKELEIASLTEELKKRDLEKSELLSKIPQQQTSTPYKGSFLSEIKGGGVNKSNKYNDMIMIIGALVQIISLINYKFQWRNRLKRISNFSIEYFLQIHRSIKSANEQLLTISQIKTPRKGFKQSEFRKKIIRKFKKCAISVIFVEILNSFLEKKKFYEGDPSFFQAKFKELPENHVLHIAKNHFLLNNNFLNEINLVVNQNFDNFQGLLGELININSPHLMAKTKPKPLEVDTSILDIDYVNLQRLIIENNGDKTYMSNRKSPLKEKFNKEIEGRIRTLNSEKKEIKRKLDGRSKKLEDVEKKCVKKERICKENEKYLQDLKIENSKLKGDSLYMS